MSTPIETFAPILSFLQSQPVDTQLQYTLSQKHPFFDFDSRYQSMVSNRYQRRLYPMRAPKVYVLAMYCIKNAMTMAFVLTLSICLA